MGKEHLIIVQGSGFPANISFWDFVHGNQQLRLGFRCWRHLRSGSCLLAVGNEHSSSFSVGGVPANISFWGFVHGNQQLRLGFWCWQHLLSGSCFACGEQGTPHHRSGFGGFHPTSPFGVLCIATSFGATSPFRFLALLAVSKEHLIIVEGLGFSSQHLLVGCMHINQ